MKIANALFTAGVLAVVPAQSALATVWVPPVNNSGSPDNLEVVVQNVTNWILGFIGMVAVLFIIWGGVQYLTSGGNQTQMEDAKTTIKNAVLGLVIAGIAYAIVTAVIGPILGGSGAGGAGGTAATGVM